MVYVVMTLDWNESKYANQIPCDCAQSVLRANENNELHRSFTVLKSIEVTLLNCRNTNATK